VGGCDVPARGQASWPHHPQKQGRPPCTVLERVRAALRPAAAEAEAQHQQGEPMGRGVAGSRWAGWRTCTRSGVMTTPPSEAGSTSLQGAHRPAPCAPKRQRSITISKVSSCQGSTAVMGPGRVGAVYLDEVRCGHHPTRRRRLHRHGRPSATHVCKTCKKLRSYYLLIPTQKRHARRNESVFFGPEPIGIPRGGTKEEFPKGLALRKRKVWASPTWADTQLFSYGTQDRRHHRRHRRHHGRGRIPNFQR
jgi:hypothetical protein